MIFGKDTFRSLADVHVVCVWPTARGQARDTSVSFRGIDFPKSESQNRGRHTSFFRFKIWLR